MYRFLFTGTWCISARFMYWLVHYFICLYFFIMYYRNVICISKMYYINTFIVLLCVNKEIIIFHDTLMNLNTMTESRILSSGLLNKCVFILVPTILMSMILTFFYLKM